MDAEEKRLQKRFAELAFRAAANGCWTNTAFLTPAEQAVLQHTALDAPYLLAGGYADAERRIALFGSEALCGYPAEPPFVCLKLEDVSPKFAEQLTHRDYLGALMGLGIRREILGDIVLEENAAYLFCMDSIAGFIMENCGQVRRTAVKATRVDILPELLTRPPEPTELIAASERLDAVLAAVWQLSRREAKQLSEDGRVFIDGRSAENPSAELKAGEMVSLRGYGRFLYEEALAETRRGRLRIKVRKY